MQVVTVATIENPLRGERVRMATCRRISDSSSILRISTHSHLFLSAGTGSIAGILGGRATGEGKGQKEELSPIIFAPHLVHPDPTSEFDLTRRLSHSPATMDSSFLAGLA
jgi:hypothetical protein